MAARLNPRLAGFATQMRNEPTPIEAALWRKLRSSQLGGFKFLRQAVLGSAIADFFCPSIGLVIEIDGETHDTVKDARRDAAMREQGYEVLRFTNRQIGENIEGVLATILAVALTRPPRFPAPPLQGRGERRAARGPGVGHAGRAELGCTLVPHPPTPSPGGEGEQKPSSPPGEGLEVVESC